METDARVRQLAKEASAHFIRDKRDDGTEFWHYKEDAPAWVHDLVNATHDSHNWTTTGWLPDDYRYEFTVEALDAIADSDESAYLEEVMYEIEADIYTGSRIKWLESNLRRLGYVDETQAEMGGDYTNIADHIGMGQEREKHEVFSIVLEFLRDHANDEEDEGGEFADLADQIGEARDFLARLIDTEEQ